MRQILVRYKVKPEHAVENQRLLEAVFAELKAKAPPGTRYLVLKMPDESYVHFAMAEEGMPAFTGYESFKTYTADAKSRLAEGPVQVEATIIGNYRMLPE